MVRCCAVSVPSSTPSGAPFEAPDSTQNRTLRGTKKKEKKKRLGKGTFGGVFGQGSGGSAGAALLRGEELADDGHQLDAEVVAVEPALEQRIARALHVIPA